VSVLLAGWLINHFLLQREKIDVAISTNVSSRSTVGSSEVNTFELFLKQHPDTLIEMHIVNDQWKPEIAKQQIQEAQAQNIDFFITSHPSNCAVSIMELFSDSKALAMVTASTTTRLSGVDDGVIRITPDLQEEQFRIAQYVQTLPGKSVLVITDAANLAYSGPAFEIFERTLREGGNKTVRTFSTVISEFDIEALEQVFKEVPYDILYILAGSFQPVIGNVAQLSHTLNPGRTIVLTPWTRTPELIATSGQAMAYMVMPSVYPSRHDDPLIKEFYAEFYAMFGYSPISMSLGVYQSLEILDAAFKNGKRTPEAVKQFVLERGRFSTRFGEVVFDQYGDYRSDFYFMDDVERELEVQ
jgi:ABC-type branched-subunit amino acid transport system substrate-binding protein